MNQDPRCCGSGTCIIDNQGHCWCGQQWDGQAMCPAPTRTSRRAACLTLLGLLAPMAAGAAALAEPDASAVRKIVQAQLDAFAADDAERAFSFASSGIRSQFGDATSFMAMVLSGYPMVVRPAAVSFLQAQANDEAKGTVLQPVLLRDGAGRLWRANYLLERQRGAGWRISGCVVVADSTKSLT